MRRNSVTAEVVKPSFAASPAARASACALASAVADIWSANTFAIAASTAGSCWLIVTWPLLMPILVLLLPSERCSTVALPLLSDGTADCADGDSASNAAAIAPKQPRFTERFRSRPHAAVFRRRNILCPPVRAAPSQPERSGLRSTRQILADFDGFQMESSCPARRRFGTLDKEDVPHSWSHSDCRAVGRATGVYPVTSTLLNAWFRGYPVFAAAARSPRGGYQQHEYQSSSAHRLVPPRHASRQRRRANGRLRPGSALRPRRRYSVRIRRVEVPDGGAGSQSEARRRDALRHPQSAAAFRRASIGHCRQYRHPGVYVRQPDPARSTRQRQEHRPRSGA